MKIFSVTTRYNHIKKNRCQESEFASFMLRADAVCIKQSDIGE